MELERGIVSRVGEKASVPCVVGLEGGAMELAAGDRLKEEDGELWGCDMPSNAMDEAFEAKLRRLGRAQKASLGYEWFDVDFAKCLKLKQECFVARARTEEAEKAKANEASESSGIVDRGGKGGTQNEVSIYLELSGDWMYNEMAEVRARAPRPA